MMAVYVDDMRAPYGRMILCHMIADSSEELHTMAAAIGVARRWCQAEGTYKEHYDISLAMRARAVERGAIQLRMRSLAQRICDRRRAMAAST